MQNSSMNEIVLFGESNKAITSSCSSCSGCSDKGDNLCSGETPEVTSEQLTKSLLYAVNQSGLGDKVTVEFKDIHTEDLSEYKDVKTLINMSFSFPILTVNKKIKYMGPFDPNILLDELKETLSL